MSANADRFDQWIRSSFTEINTELEELYFAQADRIHIDGVGEPLKKQLLDEGHALIVKLQGEKVPHASFESAFSLLGNVGMYMSACRRHGLTDPARERQSPLLEASGIATLIGASVGVVPRFLNSHLSTHNSAREGIHRSFTRLPDELLFLDFSARAIFAYKRAADALVASEPLGITHTVTGDLLSAARRALEDVAASNDRLFEELNQDRFIYSIRPYYKSYRVGAKEYRGTNAGDFAGINEIDLLLGLCVTQDPYYSQLLVDKLPYLLPGERQRLRGCMRRRSLMDQILECLDGKQAPGPHFERNVNLFVEVCASHGKTAVQHHNQLVKRFIENPALGMNDKHCKHMAAGGPPLDEMLAGLQKLRDMRTADLRDDIYSRHSDMTRIREAIGLEAE